VIGGDLGLMGARVSNPGQTAIHADGIDVKGNVLIGIRSIGENSSVARHFQKVSQGFETDGVVEFNSAHVGAQEHYWWPDAERSGECSVLGARFKMSGAFLRYYLWAQVIAGWLLSAIFVAGVTGLMRND
jgi:hypothetical protein